MVPLLDLAQRQVGRDLAEVEIIEDVRHVVRLHAVQNHQRPAGQPHVDQRLLGAEAEAAHAGQFHIQAAPLDLVGESVIDALGAVAGAAGPHADADAWLVGQEFGQPRLSDCVKTAEVLDAHQRFSFSMASISLRRARSFTWP